MSKLIHRITIMAAFMAALFLQCQQSSESENADAESTSSETVQEPSSEKPVMTDDGSTEVKTEGSTDWSADKNGLVKQVDDYLAKIDEHLEDIAEHVEELHGDTKDEVENIKEKLEVEKIKLQARKEKLEAATAQNWSEIATNTQGALKDLKTKLDQHEEYLEEAY
ncbi:hypothetical protein [Fulvivirga ligni]|uniref:hypothetical protein n=1 Tax=Fulvivirga ligni TaxID=2904246 RepID=UPI001F405242|nr:hypothetical protein [Fulvivirga ligni]UII24125.1 hypothetical protein LVD16_12945 [Fulvivirga ligni]